MSVNQYNGSTDNSGHLNNINIVELENLIYNVFSEDEINVELLDELLDIYDKHDDVPAVDVNAALERFKRDFINQGETYLTEDAEDADNTMQTSRAVISTHPNRRKSMLRYGYIAAALIVILTIILYSTTAGASVRLAIGNWTSETFSFGPLRFATQPNPELESLYKTLDDYEITDRLAPTWLPDEFSLFDLSIFALADRTVIVALFIDGSRVLTIQIVKLLGFTFHDYEKDETEIELYPHNDIDHYIMMNNERVVVVWSTGDYECSIIGDITKDEARQMIDSIYER
jgi:hypothetical protein